MGPKTPLFHAIFALNNCDFMYFLHNYITYSRSIHHLVGICALVRILMLIEMNSFFQPGLFLTVGDGENAFHCLVRELSCKNMESGVLFNM